MEHKLTLAEKAELMGLLFLNNMAYGTWFVPLGPVLDQSGMGIIKPMAFAASAVAALLSPLFFGAMADRSIPPARVFRWICFGSAASSGLVAWSISQGWNIWLVLTLIQVHFLFCTPSSSLSGSIVFSRLLNSTRQFGWIRSLGTIGWMIGLWSVSLLGFDTSPKALFVSCGLWFLAGLYSVLLPHDPVNGDKPLPLSWRERFGLDAWSLLRIREHRIVFFTTALVAIPFVAFYPYTPPHLSDLGLERLSFWMSLGQVSEVIAMIALSGILSRWNLRLVMLVGLICGFMRYILYAIDLKIPMLVGLSLHGFAFTFTYVTAQIYLAERIESPWRTRAQALLSLMTGGVGNLTGYLLVGFWANYCSIVDGQHWRVFWLGLSGLIVSVIGYFLSGFRSKHD